MDLVSDGSCRRSLYVVDLMHRHADAFVKDLGCLPHGRIIACRLPPCIFHGMFCSQISCMLIALVSGIINAGAASFKGMRVTDPVARISTIHIHRIHDKDLVDRMPLLCDHTGVVFDLL